LLQSFALLKGKRVTSWDGKQAEVYMDNLFLNTLFIKLDKPAKTVKIDGLPENVVPITRGSKNIECTFQVI